MKKEIWIVEDNKVIEKVPNFIVIKMPVNHPPFMGKLDYNIDKFYVSQILGDHSRWSRHLITGGL